MPSTMEQCLSQTLAATFEDLALICPDYTLSGKQSEAPVDVAMAVSFSGPLNGQLVLKATSHILPGIAENMLGSEAAEGMAIQRDALGELANVMCGNLLPLIGGAQAVFVLSAPQEYSADRDTSRCLPSARACVGIEDGRAVAQLLLSDDSRRALGLTVDGATASVA
ncbi:MAG: chemotaxis protein CheX [Phycisphaerae bacterium]|nr:chemotaxis protein CheX [Gemmatimonadaceae bacterium]